MPQSLARIITHIIFSTKNRERMIPTRIREDLSAYLGGILKQLDCHPLIVTTLADHVHLLCCLSRNRAVAEILREVKRGSSVWIKEKDPALAAFHWQAGYAAFSVSQSNVDTVHQYITNQEEHHRKLTFQEEFRAFLQRHRVEYDERYVWD